MNFMERTNNNDNKKRSDDYHTNYEEEDRKTTTSSSASPQGGGMNMIDPPKLLFSSTTNWPNSSSSTSPSSSTRTTALAPNLYQHYTTRGEIIRGTTSLSQQQQQQQQQVDLMDINVPWGSVVGVGEREHMFDKVVTPSDVGKLNRLVIPKQHAEKYFPLDSSTQDKGLLLNFQDVSTSKLWRFRYSYWNSSQSYVMTKGWSRFVKDKKLDPGDIVSFHRDRHKIDHLFIDCTHRPPPPPPQLLQYHHHHLLPFPSNNINNSSNMNLSLHPAAAAAPARYANDSSNFRYMGYYGPPPGGLFLPAHAATPFRGGEIRERERGGDHHYHDPVTRHNPNYRTTGYNNNCYQASRGGNNNYGLSGNYSLNDYYRHIHQQQTRQEEEEGSSSSSGMMRGYWSGGIRELALVDGQQQQQQQQQQQEEEMLLHSVPVLVQAAAETSVHNKRLRLFGVNMDCPILNYDDDNNNVEEDITILPTTIGRHNNIDTNNNNAAVQMPPPSNHPHLVQLRLNNNNHNNHN